MTRCPKEPVQAVADLSAQAILALERANLVTMLNHRANTDDLTGLCRVAYFYDSANERLQRALSTGETCAVLMMDIDDFKQVNDTYGHPAGDTILIHAASLIRDCVPSDAIAGRIGGDEFVVFMPKISLAESRHIGRQLLERFSTTNFTFVPPTHKRLTISMGLVQAPGDGSSIHELIHAADQAMYWSKRNGKAQISVSSDTFTA